MAILQSSGAPLRALIEPVRQRRTQAWRLIQERLASRRQETSKEFEQVSRIVVLGSSSRGGSSVTAELFQWQGAECRTRSGRMLSLAGEEKPHLILSGLAFPSRSALFDDLDAGDARQPEIDRLLTELQSEVGSPLTETANFELYALQLYRRLLLQWPQELLSWPLGDALASIAAALRRAFGPRYVDDAAARLKALHACAHALPFIRTSFYDGCPIKRPADVAVQQQGAWSIEETPFVFPPPWRHASAADLSEGSLLLRDPSNAWRLGFWRAVFPRAEMIVVHLARDVRETVQGLCDGWNYPFGFQTLPSVARLDIAGYSDGAASWKQRRLNFSIDRRLSERLLERCEPTSLVEVAGHQWRRAHERILADSRALSLRRTLLDFAALRRDPARAFGSVCAALNLEVSQSGRRYADAFPSRWVMATAGGRPNHERWRQSPFASAIGDLARQDAFVATSRRLTSAATEEPGHVDDRPTRALMNPADAQRLYA
jgi:hypothetical protein